MEISSSPEEAGIDMPLQPNYGHIHESSSSKLAPVSGTAVAENNNMLHLRAHSDQPNTTTAMTVVTAKKSASSPSSSSSLIGAVRYRECLKNHAAGIGGYAVDGCGEFMPSGEEGTIEALKCAACGCHRNFHRREVEGEPQQSCLYWGSIRSSEHHNHHHQYRKRLALPAPPILNPILVPPNSAQMMALPAAAKNSPISENGEEINLNNNHINSLNGGLMQGGLQYYPPPPNAAGAPANSSFSFPHHRHYNHHHQSFMMMPTKAAKRFRTKFTMEQREKMYEFAEKIGWRIQKHDEAAVQQFCVEAGVKRHVLKVWMHNNKNTFGKKLMRFPEAFDPVPETGS